MVEIERIRPVERKDGWLAHVNAPLVNEVAPLLARRWLLRHPTTAAERLLERQSDADVLIAFAELVEDEFGLGPVGPEQQGVPFPEGMVQVQRHRRVRSRPVFDERVPSRGAVEVRIELVGTEEGEAFVVERLESIGEWTGVAAHGQIPLPVREEPAPVALAPIDRVLDAGALDRPGELGPEALPQPSEWRVERQAGEIALARAEVARRVGAEIRIAGMVDLIANQDAVLKLADEVMAEVELDQPVAKQRMVDRGPEFPGALRLKVGVAAVDPPRRKVAEADEIVKVELGDGPFDRQLGVPPATWLPIQGDVGFEEFQRPVRGGVAAYLEVGEFVMHAAIDAQGGGQLLAEVDVNLAALLLHRRVGD